LIELSWLGATLTIMRIIGGRLADQALPQQPTRLKVWE
jgi:hypothetical protein